MLTKLLSFFQKFDVEDDDYELENEELYDEDEIDDEDFIEWTDYH